eukprot:7983301-Pyramimonas_sp.AAC.1
MAAAVYKRPTLIYPSLCDRLLVRGVLELLIRVPLLESWTIAHTTATLLLDRRSLAESSTEEG